MIDKDTFLALIFPPLVGIVGLYRYNKLKKISQQTKGWAVTRGTILDAKIVGWGRARSASVIYEFKAPTSYVGSRICAPGCEESDPNVYLRFYRIGKDVAVHYDPFDPTQSMLELPNSRAIMAWAAMAIAGLLFPFLYLLWLEHIKTWIVD